jgi:hypothetical protein
MAYNLERMELIIYLTIIVKRLKGTTRYIL